MQWKLLRPLAYLLIKHDSKRLYDYTIPLFVTLCATAFLFFVPGDLQVLGANGLIAIFTGLLQILTGFYIASLAAISTFNLPNLDDPMLGRPPTLTVVVGGRAQAIELTRRRFLSYMFGYLSFLAIFLYFVGAFVNLLAPNIVPFIPLEYRALVMWVFIFAFLLVASNLVVTTLLGLFYMTEKIHGYEPRLRIKR